MSALKEGLRVGPAGNSESFYAAGYKQTVDSFAWQQANFGLDAFEVPFGRGIGMSRETAQAIGQAAAKADVRLSAHAPYYINLANPDDEQAQKSIRYILSTAQLLALMGGDRMVVHVGSPKGQDREQALQLCAKRLLEARSRLTDQGHTGIRLCLETMGRASVLGSLDEIIHLVKLDASFLPCIDFAHLHAVGQGALSSRADFLQVFDRLEAALGATRTRQMHMHFSRIEFGAKGEIRHRTFDDADFGPEFSLLAPLLVSRGIHGRLICESRGTMAEDAGQMKAELLRIQASAAS